MEGSLRIVTAPSLREQVATKIRESIAQGRFRPGMRLIERELCDMLGVSRTSLREALRELEAEGLVTNVPNRGPIVAIISVALAESLYQVRGSLEALAARLFTRRASAEQIRELVLATEALEAAYQRPHPAERILAKNEFYKVLLDGAANEVVTMTLTNMHLRISQLRSTSLMQPDRAKASIEEIWELVHAIKARDEEAAHNICLRHVDNAARTALSVLAQEQAPPAQA